MANDSQYKIKAKIVGTRGVKEFRASISTYVKPSDLVLEIGCEWGTTSIILAPACKQLVATDISPECIERARLKHPHIDFRVLDVFNVKAVLDYDIKFSKMYIDVSGFSGYKSTLDVLALIDMYCSLFPLETVVIKSGSIKNLATRLIAW